MVFTLFRAWANLGSVCIFIVNSLECFVCQRGSNRETAEGQVVQYNIFFKYIMKIYTWNPNDIVFFKFRVLAQRTVDSPSKRGVIWLPSAHIYCNNIVYIYIYKYGKCLGFARNRNHDRQSIIIIIVIIITIIIIIEPLLKIVNECRSLTGVGELNPY